MKENRHISTRQCMIDGKAQPPENKIYDILSLLKILNSFVYLFLNFAYVR